MLYEMVVGAMPFEGENPFLVMNARVVGDPKAPRKVNPAVPPEVEELILHAMERDPKKRFQTALEMKEQLDDLSLVNVTGRYHHLKVPRVWSSRWHSARLHVLSVAFTFAVLGLLFLVAKCHPGHHH
jgi:serine/threonine-protein kinase